VNGNAVNTKLPEHIAMIMDGNGRWAQAQGLPRIEGHRVGMEKIRSVTELCSERGVHVLTLYAFSVQNWHRPSREVSFLMKQFGRYLDREIDELMARKVRLRIIGRVDGLPQRLLAKIRRGMDRTRENTDFSLNLAINYGGQEEIVDAARRLCQAVKCGMLSEDSIDTGLFREYLYTPELPYPDLVIRTGGEHRVSNFLLWQIAYAELWITQIFWPDFSAEHLDNALFDYANRERRFGAVSEE
jgi:undecaprenyl diphosphate synthase